MSKIKNTDPEELLKKLDGSQRKLYDSIIDNPITFCNAKAGTGKTTVATLAAFDLLNKGIVSKIYYIRFIDELNQSLGFLPGEIGDKEEIYFNPFFDACIELGIGKDRLYSNYVNNELVIMCTTANLRGGNIKDSAVIIDEAQNGGFKDFKLVLTRLDDKCHCAVMGHTDQVDNHNCVKERAFMGYMEHFNKKDWCQVVHLSRNYRGKLSQWADCLMIDKNYNYHSEG